jgi:hypothetical protein
MAKTGINIKEDLDSLKERVEAVRSLLHQTEVRAAQIRAEMEEVKRPQRTRKVKLAAGEERL